LGVAEVAEVVVELAEPDVGSTAITEIEARMLDAVTLEREVSEIEGLVVVDESVEL
jgi:hypothetical protein